MKYTRLTREQFEELHQEFINFLATQSITKEEWEQIKEKQPEVAEEEMDVFSDLVWEGVLNQTQYLEHLSPKQLFLFKLEAEAIKLWVLKTQADVDFSTEEGWSWLQENITEDAVEVLTASKSFSDDRNADVFQLIQQGAVITKGELYENMQQFIPKK